MGKAIFITGTDTGVGKTFVTCGLAALFRSHGFSVGVMKPVETGCVERDGELFPEDAWHLKNAAASSQAVDEICPYRLPEPLAPSMAAARAGVQIDIDKLLAGCAAIQAQHDITLVEGAGGLMVPLLPSYTYADFARVAKLPILIVAGNKLGVINHLLLTIEKASADGLTVLGYLLNRITNETSLAAETNREALTYLTGVPCWGELPFVDQERCSEAEAVQLFERELDPALIERVLRGL